MKISEAIPSVFQRVYPVLEPNTQMAVALSLLRFHEIDALPIGFKSGESKRLAIFGYSCLSTLLETAAKDYGKFLEMPCENSTLELSTIDVEKELEDLLGVFRKTKFGFAWVESSGLAGFASLRDLLELYDSRIIDTKLTARDVASSVFSLPKNTKIKPVLQQMFKRRIRRIFISGDKKFVSDRRIISYVFSASRLSAVAKKPETLLDAKLGDLDLIKPIQVSGHASLRDAAISMKNSTDNCLVCSSGVITPWDLVMKPLIQGKLVIKK
jgi:CBS domain-containing protein